MAYGTAVSFSLAQLLPFHQRLTSSLQGTQPKNMGLSHAVLGRRDGDTWATARHLGGCAAPSPQVGFDFLPQPETWWRSHVLPLSQAELVLDFPHLLPTLPRDEQVTFPAPVPTEDLCQTATT